ncbi:hypothetical protein [Flavobacterium jumunjinense]|uniref:DUF4369 domain-containing protein n=2 Tax=Flavobacterium TaxID=237 RepID=A0ABV5GJW5_9FLAO|nr:hypothetical protein [Flavobacterium jumunjinense]
MKQKMYYTLDFSASACMFEIRVNDYPIIIMNMDGQVASTIPINYAILESGTQTIAVTILPLLGETKLDEKAEVKFDIKVFDVSNDFVFKEMFGEYKSEAINGSNEIPFVKYNSTFIANVPYALEAWQDGAELKDVKDLEQKLIKAYRNISDSIKNKNYNFFLETIKRREENMSKSMYLSNVESVSRTSELIEDFKNGFEIMPLSSDRVLHIYGNGKVAVFKKINGESALYLFNEETQEELMLDITFYIPKGKTDFEVI